MAFDFQLVKNFLGEMDVFCLRHQKICGRIPDFYAVTMSNHQYYQECEKIWTTCPECHPTVPDATGFSSDPDAEIPATRWGEGAEL